MHLPRTPEARAAVAAFDGAPRGDRFHVRGRWLSCPFPAIDAEVPRRGRILDVGCGHGLLTLYLALRGTHRELTGADIDTHKIEMAVAAATHAGIDATFFAVEPHAVVDGPWDAVVITDVLYLLPEAAQLALLDGYAAQLAPGGRLVIKETDTEPRSKAALAELQERVSTKVLKITEGESLHWMPAAKIAAHLEGLGLVARTRRVDRGYVHPHVLVVGRRPHHDDGPPLR